MIRLALERKSYGATSVLGPLTLDIAAGEAVAILGPSGAGKSTLLRILAGLDTDFDGALACRGRVAMVFQEPALLRWRTALDNITLMTGVSASKALALMDELGLADLGARFPGQLSLGQQRRLSIARALAADPDLLLLDEPFASLDRDRVGDMIDALGRTLRAHATACVLVTHALDEARALCSRLYRLDGQPATLSGVHAGLATLRRAGYDQGPIGPTYLRS